MEIYMKTFKDFLTERSAPVATKQLHDDMDLFRSIKVGYVEDAEETLLKGANPNVVDGRGRTPLFFTVDLDMIDVLAKYGADFNHVDEFNRTPIMTYLAPTNPKESFILYYSTMVKYGADFFYTNKDNESVFDSAPYGALQYVLNKKIKSKFPKSLVIELPMGFLKAEELEEFIELGYNINFEQALMTKKDPDVIEVLLKNAPKIYPKAFDAVVLNKWDTDIRVAKLYLKYGYKMLKKHVHSQTQQLYDVNTKMLNNDASVIFDLIQAKDIESIETLIKNKVDIKVYDKDGSTPLIVAISDKKTQVAEVLIKNKVGINIPSKNKAYPIIMASIRNMPDIVKLLIDNKAKVDAETKEGGTALMWALRGGDKYIETIKLLLEAGANPNKVVNEHTALDFASRFSRSDKIEDLLISFGAKTYEEIK